MLALPTMEQAMMIEVTGGRVALIGATLIDEEAGNGSVSRASDGR
jgi:hypothetical protein